MTPATDTINRLLYTRGKHLTFRANDGIGRHDWLRLTPAYSVKLVRDIVADLPGGSVVTDPFSGTGTTPLAAAELGITGQSIDVNPFLVWLGNTKLRRYTEDELMEATETASGIVTRGREQASVSDRWQPDLFKIERWWAPGPLETLKVLRQEIDQTTGVTRDLLDIVLCRTLIKTSNAAFNHPSMSFKKDSKVVTEFDELDFSAAFDVFETEFASIIESARLDLAGEGTVYLGDSRGVVDGLAKADAIVTSPPYVNRMSYIRELRPYMYWLRFLEAAPDAGDLDWKAIGGTWGTASSKTKYWEPTIETPVDSEILPVSASIATDGGKNGPMLAKYVHKYHHDMWEHFKSIPGLVKPGGSVSYIIGNSTFYGHEVPAHDWYAKMLEAVGVEDVNVEIIRKRNSNKKLYEFNVSGHFPGGDHVPGRRPTTDQAPEATLF